MKRMLTSLLVLLGLTQAVLACTIIAAGKKATADGSIILSHTDCGPNSRIVVVPAATHRPGELAGVHWGIQDPTRRLGDLGEVLGTIPQVTRTFAYIHSAYSHLNEVQLGIAESTTAQRAELVAERGQGEGIMTIEQAQVFALQRCRKAREAVLLVGRLMEEYGFLPSSGDGSETLVIGDTEEAWVLEVFGVGPGWKRASGKPGAIWAAERIPDDGAVLVPNWSIIEEVHPEDPSRFLASQNYRQEAIDRGWYDPASGKPFVWRDAYAPLPNEVATSRLWLFATTFAPRADRWPDRRVSSADPWAGINQYFQTVEPYSIYPFSFKVEKKIAVADVMAFQRSTFTGTIYDLAGGPQWLVPDGKGGMVRSPLATPFPGRDLRRLLNLTNRRPVARHRGHYGMVLQLRGWLPDAIGGVYWVYLDNPTISPYVPLYSGSTATAPCYQTYHPDHYSDQSARWTIDFVDNLANTRYQEAIVDVNAVREPFEKELFDRQPGIEQQALALFHKNPAKAKKFLTDYCLGVQDRVPGLYIALREALLVKYTNNRE